MILPHPESREVAGTTSGFNPYAHYEEVMIPMRDGIRLAADVHFPVDEDGERVTDSAPVLLVRTSYDKSKSEWDTVRDYYPRHGYVFVNQDLRSRFRSEGDGRYYHTCNPWEGEDGYDTIEWIAKQPWCNGKVGTIGSSHRGIVQTVAALHRPPHLVAQWVEQAPTNIYAHEAREGGAMCFHMAAAIHNHALDSHELRDHPDGGPRRDRRFPRTCASSYPTLLGNAAKSPSLLPLASKRPSSTTTHAANTTSGGRTRTMTKPLT